LAWPGVLVLGVELLPEDVVEPSAALGAEPFEDPPQELSVSNASMSASPALADLIVMLGGEDMCLLASVAEGS
jgi:hypothetical protein